MDADVNSVIVTGTIERAPTTRIDDHGKQRVGFTLRVAEAGPAGQAFTLFLPVESYGPVAELAGALHAGAVVLVSGKLKWTSWTAKNGEKKTSLTILARLLRRLENMVAPATV